MDSLVKLFISNESEEKEVRFDRAYVVVEQEESGLKSWYVAVYRVKNAFEIFDLWGTVDVHAITENGELRGKAIMTPGEDMILKGTGPLEAIQHCHPVGNDLQGGTEMKRWEEADIQRWYQFSGEQTGLIIQALWLLLEKGELTEEQRAEAKWLHQEAMESYMRRYACDYGINW